MGNVIFGMTMSLDGFINDRDGGVGMLYPDFETLGATEPMQEAIRSTGAVVMGWHAFAMAEDPDSFAERYEFQVPIFVLTHTVPSRHPKETERLTITFVTEGIEAAIAKAKAAAGPKDVTIVGGAKTAMQSIRAGLVDEIHIDIMPILLSGGLRLFETLGTEPIHLERLAVEALPAGRTHLRFRIMRDAAEL